RSAPRSRLFPYTTLFRSLRSPRSAERAVRAVIDNNVWVSGLFKSGSKPGEVLTAFEAGRFTAVISQPLLDELADVLSRSKIRRRSEEHTSELQSRSDLVC